MPDGPYEALAARLDDGRVIVVTQPTGRPVPDLVSYAREVPPHANSPACRFAAPEQHFSATVIRRSALVPPSPVGRHQGRLRTSPSARCSTSRGSADGDRDGPSPDRRRPGRNGRVKVVPVQVVRGDEPRAWTDIHAAIVDLLAGYLPATDRR